MLATAAVLCLLSACNRSYGVNWAPLQRFSKNKLESVALSGQQCVFHISDRQLLAEIASLFPPPLSADDPDEGPPGGWGTGFYGGSSFEIEFRFEHAPPIQTGCTILTYSMHFLTPGADVLDEKRDNCLRFGKDHRLLPNLAAALEPFLVKQPGTYELAVKDGQIQIRRLEPSRS